MQLVLNDTVRNARPAASRPRLPLDYRAFRDMSRILAVEPSLFASGSQFACLLAVYFPETARCIDEDDFGVLHLEVGVLRLASKVAIVDGDWDMLSRHYAFVAALLAYCGGALRQALEVSYLGSLFYGESSAHYDKARSLLPPMLAYALAAVEHHYAMRAAGQTYR